MEEKKPSPAYRHTKIALIVLGAALGLLCVLLVRQYFVLRRENLINARELPLSAFVQKHGSLTAAETGVIRTWMTFDYVNRIFGLPPDVLKNSFRIDDPSYPHLTLSHYAREKGFDETEFLNSLDAAVANYLNQPH